MKHKHTPTPWTVETYKTKRGLTEPDLYEIWGESHKIADVPKSPFDNSAKHDSAYIVEACNAYPALKQINAELVEALSILVEHVKDYKQGRIWSIFQDVTAAIDRATTVLAHTKALK